MSFLSNILKGAIGFVTGGPVGAAAGLLGGVLGDKAQGSAPKGTVGTMPALATSQGTTGSNKTEESIHAGLMAGMLQEMAAGMAGQKPVTHFDEEEAMKNGMSQLANQRGGMATEAGWMHPQQMRPWPANISGQGAGAGGGEGRGAGGNIGSQWNPWDNGVAQAAGQNANALMQTAAAPKAPAGSTPESQLPTGWNQQVSLTPPLISQYQKYMTRAMAGQAGLPANAYQAAMSRGMSALNAQAQNSRESLMGNLGARGLMSSGLMARGLRGVEESRLGGVADLTYGLNQQDLAARTQAQQAAMGQMPTLMGVEQNARDSAIRGALALRQLEMQAAQLGLSQQQIDAAKQATQYGLYANLGSALASYFWPSGGGQQQQQLTTSSDSGQY